MRTGCPDLDLSNGNLVELDMCDMGHSVQPSQPSNPQPKPAPVKEVAVKVEKKETKKEKEVEEEPKKEIFGLDQRTAIIAAIVGITAVTIFAVWGLKKITTIQPIRITA